ncbi:MAG TPA: hypothetical protein VFA60_02215 [Terriglobales bacterium]|nr:hypothetical protein [Terriglobales bacterium]
MQPSLGTQLLSFSGALMILIAYAGHQFRWMSSSGAWYNILNAVGSGILAYIAFKPFQLGFVVLEVTWVAISIYALWRGRRGRGAAPAATKA